MKKLILVFSVLILSATSVFSQKFAYVDTDYILGNIPAYKEAQEQLDKLVAQWEEEIKQAYSEIEAMYKQFQVDQHLLTEDMKRKKENEIIEKEKELKSLQRKRFGPEGDRFKKEQELIKPIQDEIYNAIKELAVNSSYGVIFDAASSSLTMLYTDSKYDVSDDVLKALGYIK